MAKSSQSTRRRKAPLGPPKVQERLEIDLINAILDSIHGCYRYGLLVRTPTMSDDQVERLRRQMDEIPAFNQGVSSVETTIVRLLRKRGFDVRKKAQCKTSRNGR